ncbi:alpha-mannosyl-glycoprotein 2-beta-n-acetylglucosaminyltransferase [Blastocystis sp. subtype 4]|uniref:alpha-mannosyl-glycoprotein 2-beta-n-acetylglucosaminyltransferase n=1 Tax=Blastocystis sp. subtype 4 TaxID=944170 RepID=UPI000711A326|nr:alpha-mannosyl-glycoprotein 2-beta-n-acetylglucosaminyltransferase [Blastocystis sp. subtype 4]KNB42357.1 alpha-mannosyl-glycoprotein 2-beta-n-acetylglucosaminyltransferase [Blastocystis sp. subtype 4]|eukprot:XP_014525800.1 alpha-mannosyl-glycoprotein 2-beta-n-acetylglucosaminyltransferase [Blastocystis sp. subtype 4]
MSLFSQIAGSAQYESSDLNPEQIAIVCMYYIVSLLDCTQKNGPANCISVPSSLNPASFSDSDFLSACGISEVSQQECQEKPYSNVFLSSPAHRKHISPKETILASDNGSGKWLIGGHKTALVILTYNRAQYLLETANRILEVLSSASTNYLVDVFIAIDGDDTVTKNMATSIQSRFLDSLPDCPVELIEHKRTVVEGDTGYNYVARNMKNAFDTVLVTNKYDQAIILDDDMFIAEDFFDYFSAMSFILYEDPSVYAISAYNDNGQDSFILDNTLVLRSDFFTGGAWMLTSTEWNAIRNEWPDGYWNDWMHQSNLFLHRACIRPEVSRVITFGVSGINSHPFFLKEQLGISLNRRRVDFLKYDFAYLLKDEFDLIWRNAIEEAVELDSLDDLISAPLNRQLKIYYSKKPGLQSFRSIADKMGIMGDVLGGIPRTAYMGVVTVGYKGFRLYLVPREGLSFDY